jgi:uncharacterized protein (DUF2141 family)
MKTFTIICMLLCSCAGFVRSQDRHQPLVVTITQCTTDTAKCVVLIFREQDEIPHQWFKRYFIPVQHGQASVRIDDLDYGNYAMVVFQDLNSNAEIDHSWGIPSEPIGFPNHWRPSLFSGKPSFSNLRFEYSENNHIQEIEIKPFRLF